MIYETDLFSFSFVPNWYLQLDALAELALSEPWRFRSGGYSEKNYDTPILAEIVFGKLASSIGGPNPLWQQNFN